MEIFRSVAQTSNFLVSYLFMNKTGVVEGTGSRVTRIVTWIILLLSYSSGFIWPGRQS